MKILVTGGAGFIGSHVAKKLIEQGNQVVIIDDLNDYYSPRLKEDRLKIFLPENDFTFHKADISKFDQLEKIFSEHKFDCLCHLAAQAGVRYSLTNPWIYEQTNTLGTLNLLELTKKYKINKFVFASSSSVYGGNKKQPFSESDKVEKPLSLYAATKLAVELMAYTYSHLYGIKITGLRFFTVYGPWGRPDMACFKFADLFKQGSPIDVYNNGKMKRDFTYIDDIVAGVISAIKIDFTYEIFNLGNNKPEELEKLIFLLEENFGVKAKKNYLPLQPGDVISTWADIEKAKKLLNYNPKTTLEQGIKKFVQWYSDYYQV